MPRKRDIPKKKIIPDPIYNSVNVTRLTNMIMQDGKKRTAEKIPKLQATWHQKPPKWTPKTSKMEARTIQNRAQNGPRGGQDDQKIEK